jgi:hypothetical protein
VAIVKDGGFYAEEYFDDPAVTADLLGRWRESSRQIVSQVSSSKARHPTER